MEFFMKFRVLPLALAASVVLSGCLLPEKFTASAVVAPDATIAYQYKGTAMHATALLQQLRGEKLSADDDRSLAELGEKSSSGGNSVKYVGKGRYEVKVNARIEPGPAKADMQVFDYSRRGTTYTIESMTISPSDLADFKEAGFAPDGTFEVTLPANAKVVSNNADSTPWFLRKSYKWDIKSLDKPASLVFTLQK
jgi:hypothetical protein